MYAIRSPLASKPEKWELIFSEIDLKTHPPPAENETSYTPSSSRIYTTHIKHMAFTGTTFLPSPKRTLCGPPDLPTHKVAIRPAFPEPDPIRAIPEDYFPNRKLLGKYVGQFQGGLQSLVQSRLPTALK